MERKIGTVYFRKKRGNEYKNRYVIISYKNRNYVVMEVNDNNLTIFNLEYLEKVLKFNKIWYEGTQGYICSNNNYLHNYIKDYIPDGNSKNSYDHINRIKTDNRKENLRWTTQTIQNYNYSRPKRDLNRKKYKVLNDKIIEKLNYGQLEKYISYYYENSKDRLRYRITVDKKFPYHNKHKNFDTKNMEKIPEMYEKAKEYKKKLIEQNDGMPENMNKDYELSEEGKKLEREYNEIIEIGKNYLCNN